MNSAKDKFINGTAKFWKMPIDNMANASSIFGDSQSGKQAKVLTLRAAPQVNQAVQSLVERLRQPLSNSRYSGLIFQVVKVDIVPVLGSSNPEIYIYTSTPIQRIWQASRILNQRGIHAPVYQDSSNVFCSDYGGVHIEFHLPI